MKLNVLWALPISLALSACGGSSSDNNFADTAPVGTFKYSGDVTISGGGTEAVTYSGEFLQADFTAGTVSMNAAAGAGATAKGLRADSIDINMATGAFSGDAVLASNDPENLFERAATVAGSFTGVAAAGVSGTATQSTSTSDTMSATFTGTQDPR